MRKKIFIIFGIIAVGALLWAAFFYYRNLRGVGPALRSPSADISELIENYLSVVDQQGKEGETPTLNTTNLPLTLPSGFSISVFAKDLVAPRVMVRDPKGVLVVSITKDGRVVALPDADNDGKADRVEVLLKELNRPHGLVFRCAEVCVLYVAESHAVKAYAYDAETRVVGAGEIVADLPDDGGHFTRTLMLHPTDPNRLLISVGSSCNVCTERDWRLASVLSLDLKTRELKTFVSGLRNSVYMTAHPVTKEIWATEMGRDLLGDEIPPDEINILKEGRNYGWPYCYGKNIHDDQWDGQKKFSCTIDRVQPSDIDLPAHSAPLGIAFTPESVTKKGGHAWPDDYQYNLFVAFHGSWNRSEPTGYKIVRYELDFEGRPSYNGIIAKDFISGWLQKDGTALGRPAGLLVEPDGVMYISDDKAGVVYRVAVENK